MLEKIKLFFDSNGVEYIEQGNNVKSGNININCPFDCNDPSYHLGINQDGFFACWLNREHSGKNINKLLTQIVGYPVNLEWSTSLINESRDIRFRINDIFNPSIVEKKQDGIKKKLRLFPEFTEINDHGTTKRFWQYFISRGFTDKFLLRKLLDRNNIKACLINDYNSRIIFPIYYMSELVTWNARTIGKNILPRYKCLDSAQSLMKITDCLYDFDNLINARGKVLFIVEGGFDCLKLQYLLPFGYSTTCLFTNKISDNQIYLLKQLAQNFEQIRLLLDDDGILKSIGMKTRLSIIKNIKFQFLPKGCRDPAELDLAALNELIN